MAPFPLDLLITPIIFIAVITAIVSFCVTKSTIISFICTVVKVVFFAFYFGFFFDGTYTFLDDWTYLERGGILFARDLSITEDLNQIKMIARGEHFIYYLHNAYSFKFFGEGYYAPVACNIIITIFIAAIGKKIFDQQFQPSKINSNRFYLFLALHPDIFSWSNIANLKDILILFMHVCLIYSVSLFLKRKITASVILFLATNYLLFVSRFYVPIIFSVSFISTLFFSKRIKYKKTTITLCLLIFSILAIYKDLINYQNIFTDLNIEYTNPIIGFIRIILTPIPFNTEESYAFLNFSALFNWLTLPFSIYCIKLFIKSKNTFNIFIVNYLFYFLIFYSFSIMLQGPRHKVQLDFAFALIQFIGISLYYNKNASIRINRNE